MAVEAGVGVLGVLGVLAVGAVVMAVAVVGPVASVERRLHVRHTYSCIHPLKANNGVRPPLKCFVGHDFRACCCLRCT